MPAGITYCTYWKTPVAQLARDCRYRYIVAAARRQLSRYETRRDKKGRASRSKGRHVLTSTTNYIYFFNPDKQFTSSHGGKWLLRKFNDENSSRETAENDRVTLFALQPPPLIDVFPVQKTQLPFRISETNKQKITQLLHACATGPRPCAIPFSYVFSRHTGNR